MGKIKIGYAYLIADLFHVGHLKHLQRCKKHCDYLIVGCLTDKATMEKKTKPTIPYKERFEILKNIKGVDRVVAQKQYSPVKNVLKYKPDIIFESDSHPEQPANELVKEVFISPYYKKQSSTKIKNALREKYKGITNNQVLL